MNVNRRLKKAMLINDKTILKKDYKQLKILFAFTFCLRGGTEDAVLLNALQRNLSVLFEM